MAECPVYYLSKKCLGGCKAAEANNNAFASARRRSKLYRPGFADLQEARVKKSVGLGGWHWLLLKDSGEEVRLQRNALQVISLPTGQESVTALPEPKSTNWLTAKWMFGQSGCLQQ